MASVLIGGLARGDVQIGEHRFQLAPQGAIVLENQQFPTLHRDGHQRAPPVASLVRQA